MDGPGIWLGSAQGRNGKRFYLSDNGRAALGPFSLPEVRWMIRCRHFSKDVLMRPERELEWLSYRTYISRARRTRMLLQANRIFRTIVALLRRFGILSREQETA